MRLTGELVESAEQRINPLRQREILLRGFQIAAIENLGTTQDSYDSIDLSHNNIVKLENFPRLNRLESLILSHNRISRVEAGLHSVLPNLKSLVLLSNHLATFDDIAVLSQFQKLERLCLLGNRVTRLPNYRLFVIHLFPRLRVLDFHKVKPSERSNAVTIFGTSPLNNTDSMVIDQPVEKLTREQKIELMNSIENAQSIEEIDRLQAILETGIITQ